MPENEPLRNSPRDLRILLQDALNVIRNGPPPASAEALAARNKWVEFVQNRINLDTGKS